MELMRVLTELIEATEAQIRAVVEGDPHRLLAVSQEHGRLVQEAHELLAAHAGQGTLDAEVERLFRVLGERHQVLKELVEREIQRVDTQIRIVTQPDDPPHYPGGRRMAKAARIVNTKA